MRYSLIRYPDIQIPVEITNANTEPMWPQCNLIDSLYQTTDLKLETISR